MPIKTGRVRRNYSQAISDKKICPNMLFMALAYLNFQIDYNDKLTDKQIACYQKQRVTLAKAAISNGISKKQIVEKIGTLSEQRYPSDNQVQALIELVESNDYSFLDVVISDSDYLQKSDEELEKIKNLKRVKRNTVAIQEESFAELCSYIKDNFMNCVLSSDMVKRLQKLRYSKYSCDVILQACRWYEGDILKSANAKCSKFKDDYAKFCYIISIIERKLPDTVERIEKKSQEELRCWESTAKEIISGNLTLDEAIAIHCDKYPDALYYGQNDFVKEKLLAAIERVKSNEEEKQTQEMLDDISAIESVFDANEPKKLIIIDLISFGNKSSKVVHVSCTGFSKSKL